MSDIRNSFPYSEKIITFDGMFEMQPTHLLFKF